MSADTCMRCNRPVKWVSCPDCSNGEHCETCYGEAGWNECSGCGKPMGKCDCAPLSDAGVVTSATPRTLP